MYTGLSSPIVLKEVEDLRSDVNIRKSNSKMKITIYLGRVSSWLVSFSAQALPKVCNGSYTPPEKKREKVVNLKPPF